MKTIVYDGAEHCALGVCPIVEHDHEKKTVKIFDPHKPESGAFEMKVEEYNNILKHGKPIED